MQASESKETAKWLAEQSLTVALHYSELRVQATALNFAGMGIVVAFADSGLSAAERTLSWFILIWLAVVFGILSFKLSSAHAYHWGLYEKSRDNAIADNSELVAMKSNIQTHYDKYIKGSGVRKCYGWIVRIPHWVFWPLANLLIPTVAAVFLFFLT